MKKGKANNFTGSLAQQTNTYLTDGGSDVILGKPPVVVNTTYNPLLKRPLTSLIPPVIVPPPTQIIPYKSPDLPAANTLITGLQPSTQAIPSAPLQNSQPVIDPIITDKRYINVTTPQLSTGFKPLNTTGSLLGYRDQLLAQRATWSNKPVNIWVWLILAAILIGGVIYYAKKKGKI